MANRVETDISVQRFAFEMDDAGKRLVFPHATTQDIQGRSGAVAYGVKEALFEGLEGRLDTVRWTTGTASFGSAWIRDDSGRFEIEVDRIEMPDGLLLTRADSGVELIAPQISFQEMRLSINGPFGRSGERPARDPGATPSLRQESLRFLDSLGGQIDLTVKVVLDLPVIGKRTLDQKLKVPIQEGSLDFRALEDSLDWLEGRFIDISAEGDTLALTWKVPIFGSARELVTWKLDEDAQKLAAFGRVPVRSLADYRIKGGDKEEDEKPDEENGKREGVLQALSVEDIDIAIGLVAPRSLEVGSGLVMFGGEDQPGMVDLKVTGGISDRGPGKLTGAIGSVDTTIKDMRIGPAQLTADRLHFDGLDRLEVTFDGFEPVKITMVVHRVTATNIALHLGGKGT
ncbi:MAG: hypothetical protein H0T46_08770 [Deltaproteobacteria bacterium]|nr:hypothetical protein [Deltaproteobacteria bacterium]